MDFSRKLPIGIQSFEDLRQNKYLYVDKTEDIFNLVHSGKVYFLSRPRRFGKSLLISTLKAYFEGKKELFEGLKIVELEKDNPDAWKPCPVMVFSLASGEFTKEDGLRERLKNTLLDFEQKYDLPSFDEDLPVRFGHALKNAWEKTGAKVTVLVDEYDNPLLKNLGGNSNQEEENKSLYKGFFAVLKDYDDYLNFALFTGVTKFSKVSIFSDLNQLNDISLDVVTEKICGISQEELETVFAPEIEKLAEKYKYSKEECLAELKRKYDGYHFSEQMTDMYNPFSLLNAFQKNTFGNYWFESGTPSFLVKKLRERDFDIKKFSDDNLYATASAISDYRPDNPDIIPLFYQTGYLTIKGYDEKYESYCLGYPNAEVKYGFINCLAPEYLNTKNTSPLDIRSFGLDVDNGRPNEFMERFKAIFANLPYPTGNVTDYVTEQNFQNAIYIIFMLLGKFVRTEIHSAKGRADCIVETDDYVYIFEFKRDSSAKEALAQIEDREYAAPYSADKRKLFKIGVNFSTEERNITEWEVV